MSHSNFARNFAGERRAFGRRNSCIHAALLIPGRGPIPCVVKNFSPSGALLEVSEAVEPPFNVKVRLPSGGGDIDCEVRHARGQRIGIRFIGQGAGDELARALGAVVKARPSRPVQEAQSPPRVNGAELRRVIFRRKPA